MKIDIGIKIDLPKLLESRALIEADSGAGKSWLIRKMAEECSGKVQQIIIDPEGDFLTLREKYPFALVCKKGGDLPLSIRYAEALAHKILETGISVIIDLYEFKQHEREQFVKIFTEALIDAPKKLRRPCIVYFDESQLFCPEDKSAISTHAVIDICTRGRKRGLCPILSTLRVSILNKSAAAQCKNKLIGSTSLPLDQKRVAQELGLYDKEEIRNLRNLDNGEFYAFGVAISKEIIKFKVGQVKTTHIKSGTRLKAIPPTPAAIRKIVSKLESIPEEAEIELKSKSDLQTEVSRLKAELKKSINAAPKEIIKPVIDTKIISDIKNQLKEAEIKNRELKKEADKHQSQYNGLLNGLKSFYSKFKEGKPIPEKLTFAVKENLIPVHKKDSPVVKQLRSSGVQPLNNKLIMKKGFAKDISSSGVIPEGERAILIACVQFGHSLERNQLTVLTGYKRSSRDAYIARLKQKGYLTQSGSRVEASEAGRDALGDYTPLPTGIDLQQYWLNELPVGEKAILEVLIEHHPHPVSRETLSERTGYMRSSRDAYIARMTAKEIIESAGAGMIKASDNLF